MTDELRHVQGPAWYFPTDDGDRIEPNIGVIVTGQGTVLVDSGNSPRHALRIAAALEAAKLPPVTHVIYTHHHWDHVFGGQVFPAVVVAHQLTAESLEERAGRPWNAAYLEEEARRNPAWEPVYRRMQRAVVDWDGFRLVLPTVTFTHDLTLFLDGVTIRIEHVGGKHAPDSSVVIVPEAQTAFVGDSYYASVQRPIVDKSPDTHVLERLFAYEGIVHYVDGHTAKVLTQADYDALRSEIA